MIGSSPFTGSRCSTSYGVAKGLHLELRHLRRPSCHAKPLSSGEGEHGGVHLRKLCLS